MKIAYLANYRFPSERAHTVQVAHMCAALIEQGAEVDLFVSTRLSAIRKSPRAYYNLPVDITVHHLSYGTFFPRVRATFYLSEWWFTLQFLLRYGARDYDQVYVRSEWLGFFLSWWVPRKKLVWESHEAHYSLPARWLLWRGVKTVVISEGIYDAYLAHGVPATQLLVAHDAIDDSFFHPTESKQEARRRLGIPEGSTVVMYAGGFDTWKGIETFLAAGAYSSEFLFVAIGGMRDQVERYKREYPHALFLGQQPYSDLPNNQQAADILVVPNSAQTLVSEKYTSPLKLFAHMASGIPLVVSRIPSLLTVTGEEQVSVFTPDDPHALADAIDMVGRDRETKLVKAKQLQQLAEAHTWQKRAHTILGFMGYTTPHV